MIINILHNVQRLVMSVHATLHKGRQWPSEDIQDSAHVLLPVSEIAGDRKHPTLGVGFTQLWKEFDNTSQRLKQVKQTW